MKLDEFINNLNDLVKTNPEAKNLTVIYSENEEGNNYNEVIFSPSIGFIDDDGEFGSDDEDCNQEKNAVCIN